VAKLSFVIIDDAGVAKFQLAATSKTTEERIFMTTCLGNIAPSLSLKDTFYKTHLGSVPFFL
jgi:hypothetical protein